MTEPSDGKLDDVRRALLRREFRSDAIVIDQAMIDRFADLTEDRQYIHVDPDAAAAGPFGGTIAHGFLVLSLLATLYQQSPGIGVDHIRTGVNYGFDRIRFVAPVRSGSRITARFGVEAVDVRPPDRLVVHLDTAVYTSHEDGDGAEQLALSARWLSMVVLA